MNNEKATQYYVAKVTQSHESKSAEVGDRELILTDEQLREGQTKSTRTHGGEVPAKILEIIGGPFECPPMPHVLKLERWFKEEQPEDAWSLYASSDPDRAIPWYVIQSAFEQKSEGDNFAVFRSDNDWEYAETLEEANRVKQDLQSATDHTSPIPHTTAVIELTTADDSQTR